MSKNTAYYAVAGVLGVALLGGGIWWWNKNKKQPPKTTVTIGGTSVTVTAPTGTGGKLTPELEAYAQQLKAQGLTNEQIGKKLAEKMGLNK